MLYVGRASLQGFLLSFLSDSNEQPTYTALIRGTYMVANSSNCCIKKQHLSDVIHLPNFTIIIYESHLFTIDQNTNNPTTNCRHSTNIISHIEVPRRYFINSQYSNPMSNASHFFLNSKFELRVLLAGVIYRKCSFEREFWILFKIRYVCRLGLHEYDSWCAYLKISSGRSIPSRFFLFLARYGPIMDTADEVLVIKLLKENV